jgi:carbon monoxide dehydrogenase subunit G
MKLSIRSGKEVEVIFDYLTDMQKFVSVHPVIFQMDKMGKESYLVHETLKFGLVSFSFSYPVVIEKNDQNKTVIMKATVFKFTSIEMKFVLKVAGDSTLIEEEIQFTSPLPVKFLMERIFRNQHQKLFKNIELV